MREPALVPVAIFAPGHCMICGGSYGSMIDTRVDIPGDGRMYICTHICVPLILGLVENVPIRRHCSAVNTDGSACQGWALPNRDVCVAHAKTKKEEEEDGRLVGADTRE